MSDPRDVLLGFLKWKPDTQDGLDVQDAIRAVLAEPCRYCGSPSCEGTHELGTAKRIEWLEARIKELEQERNTASWQPLNNKLAEAEARVKELENEIARPKHEILRQLADTVERYEALKKQAEVRIKELEASMVRHFHEEHLAGDGPEIDRWKASNRALIEAGDRLLDCVDLTKVYRSQIEAWEQAKREAGK